MIDFSQVTDMMLGNTPVEQVSDSLGNVLWSSAVDPSLEYFYIEDISGSGDDFNIFTNDSSSMSITLEYSYDKNTWTTATVSYGNPLLAYLDANEKVYIKAVADTWYTYNISRMSGHNVGGNIMSLLYGDNFIGQTAFPANYGYEFGSLFEGNDGLYNAENLSLPATTLNFACYESMFKECRYLETAPALPATTLAPHCYSNMFYGCISLETAPELPADTLDYNCYDSMFYGCTALLESPVLPATTLVDFCYQQMFYGCTYLKKITTYADDISAQDCLNNWVYNAGFVYSAGGSFYNLGGATYPSGDSGIPSGWTEHNSL